MRKEMFITVGTSLYYSASWEDRPPAADVLGYPDWLKGERRQKPEARRKYLQGKTEDEITKRLTADPQNVVKWTEILPQKLQDGKHDPKDNLRFSAELSSLLMLADHERLSVRDLLSGYEAIHVVVDPNDTTSGSSYVAGVHLQSYLQTIGGTSNKSKVQIFEACYLASRSERDLLRGLRDLVRGALDRVKTSQLGRVDLVASGGYKIYAVFLSQLVAVREELRLLYMHEEAGKIVRVRRGHVAIGEHEDASIENLGLVD